MNRQIKFRGKVADEPNEWVYGYLCDENTIYQPNETEHTKCCGKGIFLVRPETIGQFTGLKDKNGKEIYEGDIISNGYEKCIVVWVKEYAGFMLKLINKEYEDKEWTNPMIDLRKDEEVIGNIYDNKNLLEE